MGISGKFVALLRFDMGMFFLDRTHFCAPCVEFLGHAASSDGPKPNHDKHAELTLTPMPTDFEQLCSHLSGISCYQTFLLNIDLYIDPVMTLPMRSKSFVRSCLSS